MTRARAALAAFCAFAAIAAVRAQQPKSTASPNAPASAAGSVQGTVITDDAPGRPIARAIVTLSGVALHPALVVVADDNGRFAFGGLPAGRYTVAAARTPYLSMSYGQTSPGKGLGLPILLDAGQGVTGIAVKLPPGSAVSGRVIDERGQPMRGSAVIVQQYRVVNGERILMAMPEQPVTDSSGAYRISGLFPGEYVVCALPPGNFIVNDPTFAVGGEIRETTAAEIQWATQQLRANDRSMAAAPLTGPPPAEPPPGRTMAYGPMYAPGNPNPTAATPVTLARGEDRGGVDITMRLQPTSRIDGRVVMPDGQPAANVNISKHVGSSTSGSNSADGTFSMTNLLPGSYEVSARASGNTLWGDAEIAVSGQDVAGVVVQLRPTVTVSGRVVFDGASPPPAAPPAVRLAPSRPPSVTLPVRPDGTFQSATIVPGKYRVVASLAGGNQAASAAAPVWTLRSIVAGGQDVADTTVEVGDAGLTDVTVTFTDRVSSLSGRLFDSSGQPVSGYYVVAFSTESSLWRQGGRRQPAPARTASDGAFTFAGLPAGSYCLAALSEVDQSDLADAAFLRSLVGASIRVTLAEGEKKVQELRLRR